MDRGSSCLFARFARHFESAHREGTSERDAPLRVQEKASGTSTNGRPELAAILDFIRDGDTLIVTRIDRLARSIADLQTIVAQLKARGAKLQVTEQPIDTSTAAGKAFLDRLGVFAGSRRTYAANGK
jgi:DNA invertase Pin-like site-specific DNA recombinase